ncbi:cysteine dioxygenase family protein [Lacisediminimonas profundi]|uniref:cysteine dioxygenase family protein n=1 Tax=Lacisediminimonas profundi TaxID=2603856 RepID=UPI00124B2ABA|nr:cysteine dioxygenase [Lacisediminimonas profundi]
MSTNSRLLDFVAAMTRLVERQGLDEAAVLAEVDSRMRELVAVDDWLPVEMTRSDPKHYQQHLLYGDPLDRFSVVSFVWGPGQGTPIHNHTVWGAIGMLRGAECGQRYRVQGSELVEDGEEATLQPGQVELVSPTIGDIHRVRNASRDSSAISIHVYGGNIGRIARHVFDASGGTRPFVSGYSNTLAPNLWNSK